MAIKTYEDGFKDGVDHTWSIIKFHQKQIFREIARCEHYEHYTQSSEYKAMASLLGASDLHKLTSIKFGHALKANVECFL
jgi:hypothetical protein